MWLADSFVGRQRELALLQAKLDEAISGRGSLVLVSGEAGVGKTRLARELAAVARWRRAAVLWGACYEGDAPTPYGPWVRALGDYAGTVPPARLASEAGSGAAALAQLVPAVRAALPAAPAAVPLAPEEERFRLFDAIACLVRAAAAAQPALVVVDDLHWADRGSLLLLQHVARLVHRMRLLLVGTYRDPDPDWQPDGPLAALLASVHRETECEPLVLRGLEYTAVAGYVAQASAERLPEDWAATIYAEAGGNPFYTREILRHLLEGDGRTSAGTPPAVRHVVRHRLSRLSPAAQRALTTASAFTDGFQFDVLQAACDVPEDDLLDCLDEALRAGLVRPLAETAARTETAEAAGAAPAKYDFSHVIVRHALYDDLNPERRARLHRRIGLALEQVYAGRERAHAAALAAHFYASGALPGGEKGIGYAVMAAAEAKARYAHDRAAHFLALASALAAQHGDVPTRASIRCELAVAEAEALSLDRAPASATAALATLEEAGTAPQGRAAFLARVARALKEGGACAEAWEPLVRQGLALMGETRDLTWARLSLLLNRFEPVTHGTIEAGRWLGYDPEAVAIAQASGDEEEYARSLDPLSWRTRAETDAVLARVGTWVRPAAIMRGLDVVARDLLHRHSAFHAAGERYAALLAAGERYGSIPTQAEALAQISAVQATLGDLAAARGTAARAQEIVERLGPEHRLHVTVEIVMASVLAYYTDGDWPALAAGVRRFATDPAGRRNSVSLLAAALAVYNASCAGDTTEARRGLASLTPVLEQTHPTLYLHSPAVHIAAAAVWEMGSVEWAGTYRRLAAALVDAGAGDSPIGSHYLTIARMAALQGCWPEARQRFTQARARLETTSQRPLLAIAGYDEALALAHAGQAGAPAAALAEAAQSAFESLGMERWCRRASELRRAIRAETVAAVERQKTIPPWPVFPVASKGEQRATYPDALTPREVEVLRRIAAGSTNKEIAAALVVSVPTVERHISNIYGKIGARGRADATAYTLTHSLLAGDIMPAVMPSSAARRSRAKR